MHIIHAPSPNCNTREGHLIDMLVLHYTGMKSGANALDRMCDVTAEVSAHYMVEEDGRIFQLVDEEMRAWHAGKSYWRGHQNINQRSVGIEIVNPGHEFGYRPFPEIQMQSVVALSQSIVKRWNIHARNVVAHSDIAPTRKQDPGELFDWPRLAAAGVGLWPNLDKGQFSPLPPEMLHPFGYDITDLPAAITAFQRHFRPELLNAVWDDQCGTLLAALSAEGFHEKFTKIP